MGHATIDKSGKFTGTVYSEMTQGAQDWHDENGFTHIVVEGNSLPNIGTSDEPDYGRPTAEQTKSARKTAIYAELDRIDTCTIRPLRAKLAGIETQADIDKLDALEQQAQLLRDELSSL